MNTTESDRDRPPADFSAFYEATQAYRRDGEGSAALPFSAATMERFGIGYFDPGKHPETADLLRRILDDAGQDMDRIKGPAVIVPLGKSRFAARIVGSSAVMKWIYPTGGIPEIWNAEALRGPDGEAVLCNDLLDAVAFEDVGTRALWYSRTTSDLLKSTIQRSRARTRALAVVFPSENPQDPDAMKSAVGSAESMVGALREAGAFAARVELDAGDAPPYDLLLRGDRGAVEAYAERARDAVAWKEADAGQKYRAGSAGALMDTFRDTILSRGPAEAIPTGFHELDAILDGGLHNGSLYVLGALSSMGKTSFVLQIADFIAASGRDVLFFSVEQSREELMAKSLSRISYDIATRGGEDHEGENLARSARSIMSKAYDWKQDPAKMELMEDAFNRYREEAANLYIIEDDARPKEEKANRPDGDDRIGLDTIRYTIENHRAATGYLPAAVFIDYLQLLYPSNDLLRKNTDKRNMDEIVSDLRRMAKDGIGGYNIPIVVISSINRDSYAKGPDMAAFKESGTIEYSADVVLFLAPAGTKAAQDDRGKGNNKTAENDARNSAIKDLELCVLKNRTGATRAIPGIPCTFRAVFNVFEEYNPDD